MFNKLAEKLHRSAAIVVDQLVLGYKSELRIGPEP